MKKKKAENKSTINDLYSNSATFLIKKTTENCFKLNIYYTEDNLIFMVEDINDLNIKSFELNVSFDEFKKLNDNFFAFRTTEKVVNVIKSCIQKENYSLDYDENGKYMCLDIKYDIFDGGSAKINIPENKTNIQLKQEIELLKNRLEELTSFKDMGKKKEEAAINSFKGTVFLQNNHKILISKWIDPEKVIKFNLLFSTNKDGTSSSTFHYYCDGVFPTVTVVYDTSGRMFGGYSTHSWAQSSCGANYCRAPGSFIFNLTNEKKYDLIDEFKYAIYKHTSYGPTFGYSNYDLYIANSCTSSSSNYCYYSSSSAYNTGGVNLLGGSSQTTFQVTYYEVYQVIFE